VEDGRPPLGLLINDFGRVVVDSALIKEESADLQVFEVADGSIFCSCKTASFVAGLRMFARVRPQTLIVEASGMSDPSGLSKILSENRLADSYRVRRIVCLVDATRFPKLYGTLTAVERQVAGADLILINKTDLADAAALTALEQTLRAINSEAVIERTSYADINPTLLRTDLSRELLGDVVSCSTPETRPAAMQLVAGVHSREEIAAALSDLLPLAYRIKGWAASVEGWWYVSDNADQIEWKSTDSASVPAEGITVICAPEHAAEIAQLWRDSGVERE
jgi:G3E family GTPase